MAKLHLLHVLVFSQLLVLCVNFGHNFVCSPTRPIGLGAWRSLTHLNYFISRPSLIHRLPGLWAAWPGQTFSRD